MTLAELVKSEIEKKGITQTELARRIGTSKQNLFKKLKNDTLGFKDLAAIEKALDVKLIIYFEGGDGVDKLEAVLKEEKNIDIEKPLLRLLRDEKTNYENDIKLLSDKAPFRVYEIAKLLCDKGDYDSALELIDIANKTEDKAAGVYLYLLESLCFANNKMSNEAKKSFAKAKKIATEVGIMSVVDAKKPAIQEALNAKGQRSRGLFKR